jgi:hypothetical protein
MLMYLNDAKVARRFGSRPDLGKIIPGAGVKKVTVGVRWSLPKFDYEPDTDVIVRPRVALICKGKANGKCLLNPNSVRPLSGISWTSAWGLKRPVSGVSDADAGSNQQEVKMEKLKSEFPPLCEIHTPNDIKNLGWIGSFGADRERFQAVSDYIKKEPSLEKRQEANRLSTYYGMGIVLDTSTQEYKGYDPLVDAY